MQLKVIIVHFSAVTCSKTIFRQDFALLTPTGGGGGGGGNFRTPSSVYSIKCLRNATDL